MCMCVLVCGYVQASAGPGGGQKRALEPLEVELQTVVSEVSCEFWELNLELLQEHMCFYSRESHLSSPLFGYLHSKILSPLPISFPFFVKHNHTIFQFLTHGILGHNIAKLCSSSQDPLDSAAHS